MSYGGGESHGADKEEQKIEQKTIGLHQKHDAIMSKIAGMEEKGRIDDKAYRALKEVDSVV